MLEFACTVTPSLTLDVVVGCKPECIELMYQRRPSLKPDLSLVGGLSGLRNLETRLNVHRLELLAPHLPVSTEVTWRLGSEDPVAEWSGWVERDGEGSRKTLSLREVGKRREQWKEGYAPICLCCVDNWVADEVTPIDSLDEHPVEEVRSALAFGGFDLDAFDSRFVFPFPSSPLDHTLTFPSLHLVIDPSPETKLPSSCSFGSSRPSHPSPSPISFFTR